MKSRASIKSHPIHPILVGFPIAFFSTAFILDLLWLRNGNPTLWVMAEYLEAAGIATALGAALAGAIDYFAIVPPKSSARKRATNHALINILNVVLFAAALYLRRYTHVSPYLYTGLEGMGFILLGVAGWMGGTLVYRNQIGVDHRYAAAGKWKEEYPSGDGGRIVVAKTGDMKNDQMKLIHAGGKRIVIAKTENGYAAFEDRCSHRGGSLADGAMICGTVQCPWHGSQFDVMTGEVKAGPAKGKITTYPLREEGGNIVLTLP